MPRHEEATSLPPLSPEQEAQTAREMGELYEEYCYTLSPQEMTNRLIAHEKMILQVIAGLRAELREMMKDRGVAA